MERVQTTGYLSPVPDGAPAPVVLLCGGVLHVELHCASFTIRLDGDPIVRILDEHPTAWTEGGDGRLSALTKREMQVAILVGKCLTNRAIARQLSVAEKTVEMHLSNVFAKLAVSSRTELAALMIRTQRA